MRRHLRNFAPLAVAAVAILAGPFSSAQTQTSAEITDQAFKNIQVLKGFPANELIIVIILRAICLGFLSSFSNAPCT